MQWVLENWIWILFGGGMIVMHLVGHGGHGGHGARGKDDQDNKVDSHTARNVLRRNPRLHLPVRRPQKPASQGD